MIYVILPRHAIGEVMRGERTQLPVIDPAPIGAVVAVKRARNRRPTCLLEVTHCEPDPEGHTLTVRIRPNEHEPLLLAADSSRGYTHDPRLAMPGEPEAIPFDDINLRWRYRSDKRHTTARHEARQEDLQVRELLNLEQRLARANQAAQRHHMADVVRNEIRTLKNMQAKNRSPNVIDAQIKRVESVAYREAA